MMLDFDILRPGEWSRGSCLQGGEGKATDGAWKCEPGVHDSPDIAGWGWGWEGKAGEQQAGC